MAGRAGWISGLLVAFFAFGLNWPVFWVSQVKGLLLTLNVLLALWPALFLYKLIDQIGGIKAIALALQGMVHEQGWVLILQAWMLSAIIESLAGYGIPIAMVSPLLISMGITPVLAVTATAVGHAWAGTTGGMALSLRVLAGITNYSLESLFPDTAILLGIAIILTGFAVAFLLGQKKQWWRVLITGLVAAVSHYVFGVLGMISISALLASALGFTVGSLLSKKPHLKNIARSKDPALHAGLIAYGMLVVIMLLVTVVPWLNQALSRPTWTLQFPQVTSTQGIITPAESGYLFHFLTHPGTLILVTIALTLFVFRFSTGIARIDLKQVFKSTTNSALPGTVGMVFMVGLSTVMEHTGMTLALANGLSTLVGGIYPLFSSLIGVVGSFATGSNLNSNVLFGLLQKEVSALVNASPVVILAAQTTGGALGSMIAPAKLAVGTSTSSAKGQEGAVLRATLPICLAIALIIGVVTLLIG